MTPMPEPVAAVYRSFPAPARGTLTSVRTRILALADETRTGPLTEALKWGAPAYLTEATKAGSTIRLGLSGDRAAVFFNCNTTLVEGFRADFLGAFPYEGNRALLLDAGWDPGVLDLCLSRALTYHRDRRKAR